MNKEQTHKKSRGSWLLHFYYEVPCMFIVLNLVSEIFLISLYGQFIKVEWIWRWMKKCGIVCYTLKMIMNVEHIRTGAMQYLALDYIDIKKKEEAQKT